MGDWISELLIVLVYALNLLYIIMLNVSQHVR